MTRNKKFRNFSTTTPMIYRLQTQAQAQAQACPLFEGDQIRAQASLDLDPRRPIQLISFALSVSRFLDAIPPCTASSKDAFKKIGIFTFSHQ